MCLRKLQIETRYLLAKENMTKSRNNHQSRIMMVSFLIKTIKSLFFNALKLIDLAKNWSFSSSESQNYVGVALAVVVFTCSYQVLFGPKYWGYLWSGIWIFSLKSPLRLSNTDTSVRNTFLVWLWGVISTCFMCQSTDFIACILILWAMPQFN